MDEQVKKQCAKCRKYKIRSLFNDADWNARKSYNCLCRECRHASQRASKQKHRIGGAASSQTVQELNSACFTK